jgi:proliferating cell nuclear antigen
MKFEIEKKDKVKQFALIFRHAKLLCENVNMYLSDTGLYIQGMTSCHTSLFELKISKEWFSMYECDRDKIIGVNCELLFKCLNCLQEGQTIIASHQKDRLNLQFKGGSGDFEIMYAMPLITIDEECLSVPESDYDSDIIINSNKFSELIHNLSLFGENIRMKCINTEEDSSFTMYANDITTGNMEINIKEENMVEWSSIDELNLNLLFSIEHLKNICQFSKLNQNIHIGLSGELPLKISYSLSGWIDGLHNEGEESEGEREAKNIITFFVAPKIED